MEYTETPKLRHYKIPKQACVLTPGSSVGVPDMDCYLGDVRSPMSPDAMPAMQLLHQSGASMMPSTFASFFFGPTKESIIKPKLFARMTPLGPGQHPGQHPSQPLSPSQHQIKYTRWTFLWLTHNTNFRFLVFSH